MQVQGWCRIKVTVFVSFVFVYRSKTNKVVSVVIVIIHKQLASSYLLQQRSHSVSFSSFSLSRHVQCT